MDLGLGIVVSLKDMLSGNAGRVERSMASLDDTVSKSSQRISRNLDRIQKGTMMVGAGLAMLSAPVALISSTAATQKALGELASLGVKDLQSLEDAAESFTNQWSGTHKAQFISAAYDVRSALSNLSDEAVGTFTAMAALTAKATKATTDEMVGTFTTSYGIFKPMMSDLSDMEWARTFAGGMAQTVASFKTNGKQMSDAIKNIGAVASASNVPLEEQLAILGQLQTTMPGSEAGTLYKAFMMKAGEAGDKLGVSMIGADGRLKGIIPILEGIKARFPDMSNAAAQIQIKKAFGSDEAVKFLLQMSQGMDGLKTNIESVRQAMKAGTAVTRKMAGAMNQGLNQVQVLRQQVGNLSEILGRTLLPVLIPFLEGFSRIVLVLQGIAKSVPGLTRIVLSLTLALGAFLVVAGGVVAGIGAIGIALPAIKAGIAGFGAAMASTGAAISAYFWPVTLIIAGLVLALMLLRKAWISNFGGIRDLVEDLFSKVGLAFHGVKALISSFRNGTGEMSEELAQNLKNNGLMGFVTGIFRMYHRFRQAYEGFSKTLKTAVSQAGAILEPAIQGLGSAFLSLFKAAMSIFEVFGVIANGPDSKSYRNFGETLGTILGLIVQVGAVLIRVILTPLAWVIRLVAGVVGAVSWLVTTIVKGLMIAGKALLKFFLPLRLLLSGIQTVGRVLFTFWQLFSGQISAVDGLKKVGRAVTDFLLTPFRWALDVIASLREGAKVLLATVALMFFSAGKAMVSMITNLPGIKQLFQFGKALNEKRAVFFKAGRQWMLALSKGIFSALALPLKILKKGFSKLGWSSLLGKQAPSKIEVPKPSPVQKLGENMSHLKPKKKEKPGLLNVLQKTGVSRIKEQMGVLEGAYSHAVKKATIHMSNGVHKGISVLKNGFEKLELRAPIWRKIRGGFLDGAEDLWHRFFSGFFNQVKTVMKAFKGLIKQLVFPLLTGSFFLSPGLAKSTQEPRNVGRPIIEAKLPNQEFHHQENRSISLPPTEHRFSTRSVSSVDVPRNRVPGHQITEPLDGPALEHQPLVEPLPVQSDRSRSPGIQVGPQLDPSSGSRPFAGIRPPPIALVQRRIEEVVPGNFLLTREEAVSRSGPTTMSNEMSKFTVPGAESPNLSNSFPTVPKFYRPVRLPPQKPWVPSYYQVHPPLGSHPIPRYDEQQTVDPPQVSRDEPIIEVEKTRLLNKQSSYSEPREQRDQAFDVEAVLKAIESLANRPIQIRLKNMLDGREIADAVYQDLQEQKIKNYETF